MSKKFKYILLLALFCSAQIPAQAGWFYDYFCNSWRKKVEHLYPFNIAFGGLDILHEIKQERNTPTDNSAVKKAYPHAIAYVQKQLRSAGIDPDRVDIREASSLDDARSSLKLLAVPLAMLEMTSPESQRQRNQAKIITAHEIGHIKRHCLTRGLAACTLILAGTQTCAQQFPFMRTKFLGTFLKTIGSQTLLACFTHFEEHAADGEAIAQFKDNKQALLDYAVLLLNELQSNIQKFIQHKPTNAWKTYVMGFFYSPIKMAGYHWITDVHGSDFARANRFINAAGLTCNQSMLARMLKQQMVKQLAKGSNEPLDTSFVIEELKKIDVDDAEIAYPFQTYGQ